MNKIKMPYLENEAAEAQWWYDNREEHAEHWIAAIREGRTGEGSVARYARKVREAQMAKDTPAELSANSVDLEAQPTRE